MNQEYQYIISKLSQSIEEAKSNGQNTHFVFLNLDITNICYISILNKKYDIQGMKDYVMSVLKNANKNLDLEIDEIMPFGHSFAFIIKKNLSNFALHDNISKIYQELSREVEFFLIARFISVKVPHVSDNPEHIFMQSFSVNYVHNQENYLYHKQVDKIEDVSNLVLKAMQNVKTLIQASNDDSLCFAFQPVFSCKTGKVTFYECLLRFKRNGKIVSAAELILSAEEYKYIAMVDNLVLDMAVEKLKEFPEVSLSINFSKSCIDNIYLINKIIQNFSGKNRNIGERLIIELTETLVHSEFEKAKSFIKKMQDLGIRIAIDDFGAGYTSFQQIKSLNLDIIKIDGAFIRDAIENLDNRVFIEAIIKIAQEIGVLTVAEFVENGYTARYLMDVGVDYMQGHYLSEPIDDISYFHKNCSK